MPKHTFSVDGARVLADLRALRAIGRYKTGVHRPTFSDAHMRALKWLLEQLPVAKLSGTLDGIGNVLGTSAKAGPKLLAGSHLESQNYAGWLDGPLAYERVDEGAVLTVHLGVRRELHPPAPEHVVLDLVVPLGRRGARRGGLEEVVLARAEHAPPRRLPDPELPHDLDVEAGLLEQHADGRFSRRLVRLERPARDDRGERRLVGEVEDEQLVGARQRLLPSDVDDDPGTAR